MEEEEMNTSSPLCSTIVCSYFIVIILLDKIKNHLIMYSH